MVSGAALICPETWPVDSGSISVNCDTPFKRSDIESLPVSIPSDVTERMEHVSQLGMKNLYFGKSPGPHNRWNHAKGVYTIGLMWLHTLYAADAIPKHLKQKPYPDYETAQTLIGYSLLLHDYGHLPFSHLLEEAIHSINWVPIESGQSSLEYTVLRDRLTKDALAENLRDTISQTLPFSASKPIRDDPIRALIQLTHGWSGIPWLQAIVNSAIDADKIDYLRRDQRFLQTCGFPIQTRLALYEGQNSVNLPWLKEFLCDQFVNHLGLLCLPGRSAVAAIDLWRERLHLYERFYLAPVVRAAERITLEVVQQFLIRAVMSDAFGKEIRPALKDSLEVRDLGWLMRQDVPLYGGQDVIAKKYGAITNLLNQLTTLFGQTSERDLECFTFMADRVLGVESTSHRYRVMLENSLLALKEVFAGKQSLSDFADSFIVGDPIQFDRKHLGVITEIVRSFQHQYFTDVLIDIHVMPRVLSVPPNPRRTPKSRSAQFVQLLVPTGPAERWSSVSRELEPLTLEKVKSLERPFGRVLLLSPPEANKATARYVLDRLMAELRQRKMLYQEN